MTGDPTRAPVALRCLGTFEVTVRGRPANTFPTDKVRALLAYLALEARAGPETMRSRPHRREALASLFWPELGDALALTNLRVALHRLRQTLDRAAPRASEALLRVTRQTIQLDHAALVADALTFQELLAAAAAHPHAELSRCDECLLRLAEAADLYHGELLAGFGLADAPAFEEWLLLRREMLHQQALTAIHALVSANERRGDLQQAHLYARRQLALDPLREESYRQIMAILARLGLAPEALAQYEAYRRLLHKELGAEPEGDTAALYEQIRALPSAQAAGLRSFGVELAAAERNAHSSRLTARSEWDEAPDAAPLFGRGHELAQLRSWLVADRARLVAVVGIGGVGKTSLAAAAARAAAAGFDAVVWRSLLNAPPPDELLRGVLRALSQELLAEPPEELDAQLALLLDRLRERRCLLVLDNVESILQPDQPGRARGGYEGYEQLIRRVVEHRHRSCLLLTSREQPHGLALWESDTPAVVTLRLGGLDVAAGQAMLTARGLASADDATAALVRRYSGNPLALKLVAQTVRDLFGSDIAGFLAAEAPIFDDIRGVLDQQFARLSRTEQELLIWLAIEREPASVQLLRENLVAPGPPRAFLEALRGLRQRSLVEHSAHGWTLQNVVTEYVTDVLVDQVAREIAGGPAAPSPLGWAAAALNRFALIKATAREAVRASQLRLIMQPLAQQLLARLGSPQLIAALRQIVAALREQAALVPGYAAGNLLNLLIHLEADLRGCDFSRLNIRQAYLQGALLPEVSFRDAELASTVFTHTFGDILAVRFDPDGQLWVAGLSGGRLCLWRASDEQLLHTYQIPGAGASIATFSPDGRLLASADTDHRIRLWDIAGEQILHVLAGHPETPWSIMFSADGSMLASSGRDGTLHLWDVPAGRLQQTFQGHAASIYALAFSPDGRLLASGDADGTMCVWRIGAATPLHVVRGHTSEIRAAVFDSAGALLISAGDDRAIRVWRLPGGQGAVELVHELRAHTQTIRRLAMCADGQTLVSGGVDTFVCLWDLRSGAARHVLHGHTYPLHHLAPSAAGRILATVGTDQTICLWDITTGQRQDFLQVYSNQIYSVAWSHGGQWLASGGADGILRLWSMRARARVVRTYRGHTGSLYAVAFDPADGFLASGGRDGAIRLWQVASGSLAGVLHGHTNDVEALQFSPSGSQLVSASSDQTLRVWDVRHCQTEFVLRGHTDRVRSAVFSPDGRLIVSGGNDRSVRVWDARSGQAVHVLQGHTNGVKWVAFSRDGRLLASCSYDRTTRLWDVAAGELLAAWPAQHTTVLSLAFHPDGAVLAAGATDYTVRLWDVADAQPRATLHGHANLIESVHFSPDGRWLASGSADETIRLWDVATGACLQILRAEGPYAGMDITGVAGISAAQKAALMSLGAADAAIAAALP